ncbi:Plasmodium vivax Vir protein, putative [Plasmodium vivax]|uniref:Vir protein, putative n=1 Tax=Plasmodium vivax TaxID=5855 RepID=A0A1G4E8K4_PLAVI|nr:Plasmodium vivax Vir protein, putative [Plasmodium vivax]
MNNEGNSVRDLYDHLESQITGIGGFSIYLDFICDINKDDLNKMNILYRLYKNYTDLYDILDNSSQQVKETSLSLSTSCCKDYLEARYICDTSKTNSNSPFCNNLEIFKSKYEREIYNKVDQKESDFSDYFIKLSECPNNKIITTAVTGTVVGLIPLLGILYKFTPMRQMFSSNKGILNNDISNNDEEMIKLSLMEQENEPYKFQQKTYNIKYQSL